MSDLFNELHVRTFYRILGHGNDYSDVRCIDVNRAKVVSREIIQGEENVVRWAKTYNGQGNCFIGRNPRNSNGSITRVTTFSFDIDPIRDKGTASTNEQYGRAVMAGRRILQDCRGGYFGCSGNGVLVLYKCPEVPSEGIKVFEQKLRSFEDHVRQVISDIQGVVCDHTFDSARLVKLLGTVSTKGDRASWRQSRFIDLPTLPYTTVTTVHDRVEGSGQLANNKLSEPLQANGGHKYASRSEADFALAVHYKKAGLGPTDALEALGRHVIGRNNRVDDHRRIIEKVYGSEQNEKRSDDNIPTVLFTPNGNLDEHKRRLLGRSKYTEPELPLGFSIIDRHTWGFRRGEIFTIAARTGIGKTSIAINVATGLLQKGRRILFFTTEMSTDVILERFLCVLSKIPGNRFQTGNFDDTDLRKLDQAYRTLDSFKDRLFISDATSPTIQRVATTAREVKPDVLIFDHIQHIGGESESARVNVSGFVRGLKDIARESNCAVLALSQVRRLFRDAKTKAEVAPLLSDLKESGTIEEESGAVVILSVLSEEPGNPVCNILADLAKNRYGTTDKIGLEFNREIVTFKDLELLNEEALPSV